MAAHGESQGTWREIAWEQVLDEIGGVVWGKGGRERTRGRWGTDAGDGDGAGARFAGALLFLG